MINVTRKINSRDGKHHDAPPTRNSIAKEVEQCEESVIGIPPEWPECCIYRISKHLRKVKKEAYTPKLLSIGPFHQEADELKDMEKHKQRYLKHFLKRTQKSEEDLRKIIEDNEEKICRSYSEDCGLGSDDFVQMILLDAIFIIELFLKTYVNEDDDYILSKPWLRNGILHDLILLENQLPFFVLEKLYMFAFNEYSSSCNHQQEGQQIKEHKEDLKKEDTQFVQLSRNYFRCYDEEPESIIDEEVKHFTDLLRYLFCPPKMEHHHWNIKKKSGSKEKRGVESFGTRFCATKLDDAGLKLKGIKGDRCFLDIQTPGPGVLRRFPCFGRPIEVPQLVIYHYTETLLRNLMVMEQCFYPYDTSICSYVFLLDHLIDTEKDVDLLVHKNVIHSLLGSNKIVADLINKLCDNIVVITRSSYFNSIAQKLNEQYEYPLNRTMATLKREYFPNVFRGTATVVGLIVLVFTFWNFLRPFVV